MGVCVAFRRGSTDYRNPPMVTSLPGLKGSLTHSSNTVSLCSMAGKSFIFPSFLKGSTLFEGCEYGIVVGE